MSTYYIPKSNEDSEQETVIKWARICSIRWPELGLLHHIPNGGSRHAKEAVKLKRMGVLAGVPDLHLPVANAGFYTLYIEMKYEGGRLSQSQKDFLKKAAHWQNFCAVCYSAADAIELIENYIDYRKPFKYENLSIIKDGKVIGKVE